MKTHVNCPAIKAGDISPICDAVRLAVQRQDSVRSLVSILLAARRPSTVPWFVVAVIIDLVQRRAIWPWPHVRREVLEISPTLTNHDSTPAIVGKAAGFRIDASLNHIGPGIMFGRACHAMRREMLGHAVGLQASARPRASACEVAGLHADSGAALTAARPKYPPVTTRIFERHHRETAELLSDQIAYLHRSFVPVHAGQVRGDVRCISTGSPRYFTITVVLCVGMIASRKG